MPLSPAEEKICRRNVCAAQENTLTDHQTKGEFAKFTQLGQLARQRLHGVDI